MHGIYQLQDKLCEQLEEYGQGELTTATLEVIDKLAHATKNVDKIIENYEEEQEEYSGDYYGGMGGRRSYNRAYDGRNMSHRTRDSRGRYSGTYPRRSFDDRFNEMMMNEPDNRGEWQR